MRRIHLLLSIILFSSMILISCSRDQSKLTQIKGPYLGQKPPGEVPELFAPGIIADIYNEHSAAFFTPDGKEVFWTRALNQGQNPRYMVVLHMKQEKGVWNQPELASFNRGHSTMITSITPDGSRIYISSTQPLDIGGPQQRPTSWVVYRTAEGWSEPRLAKSVRYSILKDFDQIGESQETRNGNYYFASRIHGVWTFYRSELINGVYQKPEVLGGGSRNYSVPQRSDKKHSDNAFYVDPDEKYIIFSSNRPGGFSKGYELYISYRQSDGSWGKGINLGEKINRSCDGGIWPIVSPDGKIMFFVSSIEAFKDFDPQKCTYKELKQITLNPENGFNKVYWVSSSFIDRLKPEQSQ